MEAEWALLDVREVSRDFLIRHRASIRSQNILLHAVDQVSFRVATGETLAIVGESGCGKTTTARMIMRLLRPTSGVLLFRGEDIFKLRGSALRGYRRAVQIVFQDPQTSLSPRMSVGEIVEEPLLALTDVGRAARRARVLRLFADVGLEQDAIRHYPHEFSGGQQQRIAIARALGPEPSLVVLDEPVSALDVSIRAQIMNLLKDLQGRLGLSYILIAHDLATVRYLSDRVAVMYLGKFVEQAATEDLFERPLHPYTELLVAAAQLARLEDPGEGNVPAASARPSGCPFHPRCPIAVWKCREEAPALVGVGGGRAVACHLRDGSA